MEAPTQKMDEGGYARAVDEEDYVALTDVETAAKNPDVKRFIEERMQEVCNAKVARYQTIKKIQILPTVFSVDGGELTPTLKVKRNIVNDKYAKEIAAFYARGTVQQQARA